MSASFIHPRNHVSIELLPSDGSEHDNARYAEDVSTTEALIRKSVAHTVVTTALPHFSPLCVSIAHKLRRLLEKDTLFQHIPEAPRRLIISLLAEITHRQPSYLVEPLEASVECRHIRTVPAQLHSYSEIQNHLQYLGQPAGIFVVSGGHPFRKIQKILQIYNVHSPALELLLDTFLEQLDATEIMDAARKMSPSTHILGAWSYHTDSIHRVSQKTEHGMQTMMSQPASFMPETFQKALMDLRKTPAGAALNILVGIPHIRSLAALRFWFILMNIVPEKHPEAAFLLDKFQKADKDGYVRIFADAFTRHCLEWAISLAGTNGIHFMGTKGSSFRLLRDVLGLSQSSDGSAERAHQIASQFHTEELLYEAQGISLAAAPGLFSAEEKPQKKGLFSAELLPLLTPIRETLHRIKLSSSQHPFWHNASVQFVRMSANNHAHILPIEIITSDDELVHEIHIDIRYPYVQDIDALLSLLESSLNLHLNSQPGPRDFELLDQGHDMMPLLERLQRDGWEWFGKLQSARGEQGDAGTKTSKKREIIDASADAIITSLLEAPDQSEYIILESGSWHANGIPEILAQLEAVLPGHTHEDLLRARLQKTRYVCVDIAVEGVESCEAVLGRKHEALGISFDYEQCDLMDDGQVKSLHDKYKGKVIFARSINVLDALPNRQYMERKHTLYEVTYTTGILRSELEKICTSTIEYYEHSEKKSLLLHLDPEKILTHFRQFQGPERIDNGVCLFLKFLHTVYHIPEAAGLIVYEKILQAMKKRHTYRRDHRRDDIAHRVGAFHPAPQVFFTDSHQALHCVNSLVDMVCPGGRAFFVQLQRNIGELHHQSHKSNTGPTTYHITPCFPLSREALAIITKKQNMVMRVLESRVLGLNASSGGILIHRPQ